MTDRTRAAVRLMPRLYACEACGFLSTRSDEFQRREGLLFDNGCLYLFDRTIEPAATWVAEKITAGRAALSLQPERSKEKAPDSP